jgi:hypothetical protein
MECSPPGITMLAEMHVGDLLKDRFLASLIRRFASRQPLCSFFHATERLPPGSRPAIRKYVGSAAAKRRLSLPRLAAGLQAFPRLLESAAEFPGKRFAILPVNSGIRAKVNDKSTWKKRHQGIYDEFRLAVTEENRSGARISSKASRGTFLIGSYHAARKDYHGTGAKTTTQLLIDSGWGVHVTRVVADAASFPKDTDTLVRRASASNDEVELIELLREVSAGKPFYSSLQGPDTPFAEWKMKGRQDIAFNEVFDSVLFLARNP